MRIVRWKIESQNTRICIYNGVKGGKYMDEYMDWKGFRNYEVSVWTLQDSYITTLKSGDSIYVRRPSDKEAIIWPQARARGQIQNGQMTLNIDGTQNFTFDIPMYLYINGQKQENPKWYNTVDQNIQVLQKIKLRLCQIILMNMILLFILFLKKN